MVPPLLEKFKQLRGDGGDTNLLSRVVDELVVRTTENFPVTGDCGMWDDEVT